MRNLSSLNRNSWALIARSSWLTKSDLRLLVLRKGAVSCWRCPPDRARRKQSLHKSWPRREGNPSMEHRVRKLLSGARACPMKNISRLMEGQVTSWTSRETSPLPLLIFNKIWQSFSSRKWRSILSTSKGKEESQRRQISQTKKELQSWRGGTALPTDMKLWTS